MKNHDPLSDLLKRWEPKSPHATAKFVNDTVRAIRLRETRPAWRIAWDGWTERLDGWITEWLPAPRVLVPVAAALLVLTTALQWTSIDSHAPAVAALRWQQTMSQPMGGSTLSASYSGFVRE